MPRKVAFLLLCSFTLLFAAAAANADPTFVFLRSLQDPNNFESKFRSCISQFEAGGFPSLMLNQLDGAEVVINYQKGSAGVANPAPNGNSAGKLLYLHWDPNISGFYAEDKAPKDACATLLHELQHAGRYFLGRECTGSYDGNQAAYAFDEKMGARAENWWLKHRGLKQRTRYGSLPLDRWTRWPASSSAPVPRAPGCIRQCTAKPALVSTPNPDSVPEATAAETCRCTSFHQPGCFDFAGGVYSGGDHRSVATGSLKIIIGSTGYCQNRKSCEFKNVYVAPHLDTAFPQGATVTAIATPSKGSLFVRWGPGACRGKGATCSFKASKDSCISAQFLLVNPTAPPQSLPTVPCPEDP